MIPPAIRLVFRAFTVVAALALVPAAVAAQATGGSVVGTVKDQTNAFVPGAAVEIRNTSSGATYDTVTNELGTFSFPVVDVGSYTFRAELSGFKTAAGTFDVRLNSRTNLTVLLELGQATERVEVVGAPAAVETTSTQIADTFSSRESVELPLPSGNVNTLALLTPNTVDINTTGLSRGQLLNRVSSPVGGAVGSIGGSRARNNSFTVDGVDNNDPLNTGPQGGIIQDAVREFSVLKNSFNAEFGQATGGQFNIVTKSGSNDLHGSGFWYNQNRTLNSADYLTQQAIDAGRLNKKPPFDYNRGGATFGGPVVRNSVFFFGAFELEKVSGAGTSTTFVFPTTEGYRLLASMGPGITRQGTVARVSPYVLQFLQRWGLTAPQADASRSPIVLGTPIPVGNVSQNIPSFTKNRRFLTNFDWNPRPSDHVQFRFNYDRGPDGITPGVPKEELNANRVITNHLVSMSHVHTFSPRVLNEVRLAFHRQVTDNQLVDPAAADVPNIQVAEIPLSIGPSQSVPGGSENSVYQLIDNVTWQSGRHMWKFGTDLRNNIVTDISLTSLHGNYRWVNFEELLTDIPPTQVGQRGVGPLSKVLSNYSLNWFAQDEFKWTPRVTVNLGLRYEFNSLPRDLAVQERQEFASVPGVIEFSKPKVEHDNVAPRAGLAWDVTGNGKTSIRGGYGLSYNPIFGAFVGSGQLPAALQQVFFTTCLPNNCPIPVPNSAFLERGGIPNILAPFTTVAQTRLATQSYAPDQVRPRIHTLSASFERELTPGWTTAVRYLHTEGRKLSVQIQANAQIVAPMSEFLPTWFSPSQVPNQAALDSLPTLAQFQAQLVRPLAQYGFDGSTLTTHVPIGKSRYDGVSFELERRLSHGLQFNGNYTWSRFYDHATNEFFNSFINPRRPQDWRNLDNEWAPSVLDVPHRVVLSGIWDIPWRWGQGAAASIVDGWSVAAVYTAQSGQPWTPLSQADSVGNSDVQVQRAIVNPDAPNATGTRASPVRNSSGAIVGYLANDPNARYVQALMGSFPTAGRDSLRAPGINNVDLTLIKNFDLPANRRLQFQVQMFNALNHAQFTAANLLAVDPGLGLNYAFVGSAGFNDMKKAGGTGGARLVQLALKLIF